MRHRYGTGSSWLRVIICRHNLSYKQSGRFEPPGLLLQASVNSSLRPEKFSKLEFNSGLRLCQFYHTIVFYRYDACRTRTERIQPWKGCEFDRFSKAPWLLFSLLYHNFTNLSRVINIYKLQGKDSNLRPPGYEPGKLPLLYPAIRWPLSEVANLWIYMCTLRFNEGSL